MSCTSSTVTHGSYGCDGGWTEGAYVHLSTDADLAISFYIPCVLCLTEETASMVCPAEKVANIIGEFDCLVLRATIALSLSVAWHGGRWGRFFEESCPQ